MISVSCAISILLLFVSGSRLLCKASPSPTVNIPPGAGELKDIAGTSHVANLTRQHEGDLFIANDLPSCNPDTCVGLSSGTAGLFVSDTNKAGFVPRTSSAGGSGACECRCLPYLNTYREDLGICVDDIHECTLSPFISGSSSEKIPFVFLPLRGQIIYPSREISFPDVTTPVCAVTGSQYLTTKGWSDLRNPVDTDFPFRLFRDEGRTFLQWLGEPDLRHKMQGRLILVHLMCRDMSLPTFSSIRNSTKATVKNAPKNIFTPCVAFRVSGSPVHYIHNVSEVLFQAESTSTLSSQSEGLSTKEYVVIGVCSLLLGLIYVASVFLYLHVKKRKHQLSSSTRSSAERSTEYSKNDQVTFGAPFTRSGSLYSSASIVDPRNGERSHRNNLSNGSNTLKDDIGIVKNNPLLKHFPNLSDHSGFASDLSTSNSECEDNMMTAALERVKNMQTSVIIHPASGNSSDGERSSSLESPPSPTQENECLPEENVSIVEDMGADEKLENMRAIVNGTIRKKLYFNPAYFEPHLLMSPPPAAVEFLTKIREVIAIAKYKMASKRYQPSLNIIPEEGNSNDSELCSSKLLSQYKEKQATNHRESNEKTGNKIDCQGCPGCSNHSCNDVNKCNNCGDKRNSIQKWLENVHMHDQKPLDNKDDTNGDSKTENKDYEKSENSVKINDTKTNKNGGEHDQRKKTTKKPPPLPTTAPKIISHSLKPMNAAATTVDRMDPTNIIAFHRKPMSPVAGGRSIQKNNIYTFAETGNEIYNNPKFNHHDSPQLSQRSKASSSHRSRSSRKRIEVLDQYANPESSSRNRYEILKDIKHMPDMVYEALAKDYSMRRFTINRNQIQPLNIPTPDYDGSIDKKMKDIYNSTQGSDLSLPTPDYSTLGRKSLRQYQPDSPIYTRKSPQYLIVDYETDSLERTTSKKCSNGGTLSSPSSTNSSDLSTQPSPSLSTALPLEEEVEVRHTVYDKVEGYRKDGEVIIKKPAAITGEYEDIKYGSKQNIVPVPRIKYDTPFQGSMTIEVEHEPQSDIDLSTDSDQFEPDTLDRKPKKNSFLNTPKPVITTKNAWSEHLERSQSFVNGNDLHVSYSSLENMNSLPDFSRDHNLILRSSSSFRNSNSNMELHQQQERGKFHSLSQKEKPAILTQTFGSLREIYQSKTKKDLQRTKVTNIDFNDSGKILTLEAKHSRRQRKNIDEPIKKVMPPDVIPPENNNYYDIPKYPSQAAAATVEGLIVRKNLTGWNSDDFSGINCNTTNNSNNNSNNNSSTRDSRDGKSSTSQDETETTSNNSESTEITRVSDTQYTSESSSQQSNNKECCRHEFINNNESSYRTYQKKDYCAIIPDQFRHEKNTLRNYKRLDRAPSPKNDDPDKIEVISTRSLSNRSTSLRSGDCECTKVSGDVKAEPNIQAVFHVQISSPTNGMQIAMGLKDRAKKSKDLKNAWRKFVSMAASKFSPTPPPSNDSKCCYDSFDNKTKLYDNFEKDEGISSLTDDNNPKIVDQICTSKDTTSHRFNIIRSPSTSYYDTRFGVQHRHQELDSGYMSASDSSELYNRRYERYNFKSMTEKDHIIRIDTIEDNSDCTDNKSEKTHYSMDRQSVKNEAIQNDDFNDDCCHHSDFNSVFDKPIEINVYSSDEEEPYLSACASSESDDEGHTEDMCESGAESVETHSVLFKNIRKDVSR